MKVLVTGGAGFIGSNIVDGLVQNGYKTYVVDNLSSGRRDFLHPEAEFHSINILEDDFISLFEKIRPNAVIHLAAQINVQKSIEKSAHDAEINILGTLKVLELCKVYNSKLIYSSSAAVYGNPVFLPVNELHPIKPLSNYEIGRASCRETV